MYSDIDYEAEIARQTRDPFPGYIFDRGNASVIKHSIDIIDAEKHNTDPTRSYFDNRIAELKEKYQSKPIENDPVNHPSHYTQGGIECIEAIEAACTGLTGDEAYYVGQVIKYIWRWKHKNGLQDLKKAQWYLNRLIDKVVDKTT